MAGMKTKATPTRKRYFSWGSIERIALGRDLYVQVKLAPQAWSWTCTFKFTPNKENTARPEPRFYGRQSRRTSGISPIDGAQQIPQYPPQYSHASERFETLFCEQLG